MNNFQKSLITNSDCVWEIVKLYHPDFNNKNNIKASIKYDWVIISAKGVSIGIEFECHLMFGNKPLCLFQQELENNKFRSWRFTDDSKYQFQQENKTLEVLYSNLVNNILSNYNISKPTATQMFNYYHTD